MQKLDMQTPDLTAENIEAIARLFPNVITEKEGENGEIVKAVDFDLLKQMLSKDLVEEGDERYRLDWPGKKASLIKANTPISKTLRPVREDSVNFDTTENLYIEGDNFEVLKVLQESYLGKIKAIYIDPPYNTGNDFVYQDNFQISKSEYEEGLEITDEEGGKLIRNTDSNGRFHSDWLSMMYERLLIARDLLRDDGVIFMSIDDNEVANLRKVAEEVFGEENFFCEFVWQKRSGSMDSVDGVSIDHEYVLCFGKIKKALNGVLRTFEKYENPDSDPRGPWIADNLTAGKAGGDVYYPITDPSTGNIFYPPKGRYWPYSPATMKQKIEEGRILFPKTSDGRPMLKRFQLEAKSNFLPVSSILRNYTEKNIPNNALLSALNTKGTSEVQEIFDGKLFSFPKSTILISSLLSQPLAGNENEIVLDFFSGSSTTAQAIMQLNAKDGGNRKFIMVQIPEETDASSEAHKAGYKNICEIGKERIRRAGKKILEENKDKSGIEKLDVGFRVFRLDSSNMKDVYYHPTQVSQAGLFEMESNIREDRSNEDLLAQVMLDLGLTLDLSIESRNISGNTVFFVAGNSLVACFDEGVDFALVDEIAKCEPLKVVFRDSSFRTDADRINFETRFKKLSPETDVRVI